MSKIFTLKSVTGERGTLVVLEKVLPFDIKRIFYIYDVQKGAKRGGHGHKKAQMAWMTACGACKTRINDGRKEETVLLDKRNGILYLEPQEWHEMLGFQSGTVLLTVASEYTAPNLLTTSITPSTMPFESPLFFSCFVIEMDLNPVIVSK